MFSQLTAPPASLQTKAANYIEQLDNARCRGDWPAVPELVRKVRKHAPQRECMLPHALQLAPPTLANLLFP